MLKNKSHCGRELSRQRPNGEILAEWPVIYSTGRHKES